MKNNKFWNTMSVIAVFVFTMYMIIMLYKDKTKTDSELQTLQKSIDSLELEKQRSLQKNKTDLQLILLEEK